MVILGPVYSHLYHQMAAPGHLAHLGRWCVEAPDTAAAPRCAWLRLRVARSEDSGRLLGRTWKDQPSDGDFKQDSLCFSGIEPTKTCI